MTTKTYTSKQLELMHKQGLSKTDWQAIDSKTSIEEDTYDDDDFDIDFSDAH